MMAWVVAATTLLLSVSVHATSVTDIAFGQDDRGTPEGIKRAIQEADDAEQQRQPGDGGDGFFGFQTQREYFQHMLTLHCDGGNVKQCVDFYSC